MKKFVLLATLALVPALALAQSQDRYDPSQPATRTVHPAAPLQVLGSPILLDQRASLINSPGTGPGGADESLLQNGALAMTILGFGHSTTTVNRVAEDFVVPPGGWVIDAITTYAYQTGSATTSTITGINFQIWNGRPGDPGATVVFGDTSTNRLTSTAFTNIYRGTETAPGATNRPIMSVEAAGLNLNLPAGTYWIDWAVTGSLASGPWAPPVTINGQTSTGNARQFDGTNWIDLLDVGQQGLPLTITGATALVPDRPVPVNALWLLIALVGGVLVVAAMSRRSVG
ncbi:MAG TPA: hypothetical protein VN581_13265 [Patescibacteria group bacterium]|nr:hypothetical protein [Patescibacteria group bacterium]